MYSDFIEIIQNISKRPSMYLSPVSYDTYVHYLVGFEHGSDKPLLEGFNLWLNMRLGWNAKGTIWSVLALDLIFGINGFDFKNASKELHTEAILKLSELIVIFLKQKEKTGVEGIKAEYDKYESDNRKFFEKQAYDYLLDAWNITHQEFSKLKFTVHNGGKSNSTCGGSSTFQILPDKD